MGAQRVSSSVARHRESFEVSGFASSPEVPSGDNYHPWMMGLNKWVFKAGDSPQVQRL
jgi:hypothetical protein